MKLLITGHTSNIGKVLTSHYKDVVGVSRSTGFNLKEATDLDRIVELSYDVDHVINLANVGSTQADLLWKIYNSWEKKEKQGKIISFGTLATSINHSTFRNFSSDIDMIGSKLLLEKIHQELSLKKPFGIQPQSVLLRFANYGIKDNGTPSTSAEEMISVVDFVLTSSSYISTIDFREI